MSSLIIRIKSARSQADLARFIRSAGDDREQCIALSKYFQRLEGGLEAANFEINTSASDPVKASRAVTLTYASIANADTITVAGRVLTCVTGTPAATQEFKKVTDATATAANLVALINSDAVTSLLVVASNVLGVVTIKALASGAVGNFIPLATSNAPGFAFTGSTLAGGAGGAETVALAFSRGL